MISFATQPGSVARDGSDGHSPYSRALAETIRRPGLGIFDAFNQVGLEVKRATGGAQQPWVSSSPLDGAFYFVPPDAAGTQVAVLPPRPPRAPASTAAPAITTSDVRRFDGIWAADIGCEKTATREDPVQRQVILSMNNGVVRGQGGPPGLPGGVAFEGTIDAGGALLVFAKGITPRNFQPPNSRFSYTMGGQLEGTRGTAVRSDRNCNIKLAKQSTGAGSTPAIPAANPDQRRSATLGAPTMSAAASDVRRFDGKWLGTISCKAVGDGPAYEWQFLANVKAGVFQAVHGVVGKPDSAVFDGLIKRDGEAEISVDARTGASAGTPGHPPDGTKYSYMVAARFEGSHGTGVRLGGRLCDFVFAKR